MAIMTVVPVSSSASAPKLASKKTIKLPFCAYYIAMRRANHFTKIALIAAVCTLALAGIKYWLAVKSETDAAKAALSNTAQSLTKAMKLKIEYDLSTLDSVANLWHLDSQMSRQSFRNFVLSDYFKSSLIGMETIILTHRIKADQRAALENDPAAIQVRRDCCSGTTYDIPSQGSICRERAKNQCKITGPDKYYFTQLNRYADGSKAVLPASPNSSEFLIVTYQEPLEKNPGPLGLDMFSLPTRRDAFWESDRTGKKGITKRMVRIFAATPEFGVLVWNNVFVDRSTLNNRTILDGVNMMKKQRIVAAGGDPYSIGSVVAVYKVQALLKSIVETIFGEDVRYTRIYLFDDRDSTPANQRLLAIYDTDRTRSDTAVNQEVMDKQDQTLEQLITAEYYEVNTFEVQDTEARFKVVIEPYEAFLREHITYSPMLILAISLLLVVAAQIERWLGHPYIVSEFTLTRARIETELRNEMEQKIIQKSKSCAEELEEGRKQQQELQNHVKVGTLVSSQDF